MKRAVVILLAAVCVSAVFAAAPPLSTARFDEAWLAWDRGDYVPSLEGFRTLLTGPDAAQWLKRIALITGELYEVREVAPDGRAVRVSPTGRHAAFDTGTRGAPRTVVVDLDHGARAIAEIAGNGLIFSPAGDQVAYLRVRPSPDLSALRTDADRLQAQPDADRAAVAALNRKISALEASQAELVLRDLASGQERVLADGGLAKLSPTFSANGGEVFFVGAKDAASAFTDIYAAAPDRAEPRAVTSGPGFKSDPAALAGGRFLLHQVPAASPFAAAAGSRRGPSGPAASFALIDLTSGSAKSFDGPLPAVSQDGGTLAYVTVSGGESIVSVVRLEGTSPAKAVKKSPDRIAALAVAPDGSRVAFQVLHTRNFEIFAIDADGQHEVRVTREIQHDRQPTFLTPTTLIAIKGEPRHSRAHLYDLATGEIIKLFHNNTLRTIAPEYEWAPTPSGGKLLIVAERDGDTISPERGVYLLDFSKPVSREAVLRRIDDNLAAERALRAAGDRLFRPISAQVRAAADRVSMTRIYAYEASLFDFDSKHISQPGNARAAEYVFNTLKSFGYEPEYQWFTSRDIRTANVVATLRGTVNPDLVYVLSSHFDSNQSGPGADDNSSATAVLLETARALARTPLPNTVIFAAFTGEEAGLLGSREFVRQARARGLRVAGALNNDMIGWSNDHRLDNTIRYSNAGIRDLQHAASFLFSKMVTYDAKYYKSTDAAAYFEVYGDIVGGLGSYPVLGNPYYHQPTDLLETINHELVTEAARFNIASIMRLAYGPSRVADLVVDRVSPARAEVHWTRSPEKEVTAYRVSFGPAGAPAAYSLTVTGTRAAPSGFALKPGETLHVAVKALTASGLEGWDWARAVAPLAH